MKLRVSGSVCTAVSSRKLRFFPAETQVTVAGNTCVSHIFAETHPLNSGISEFSETAELLLAAVFPLSVNSTDKQ